tara:strand:+ start:798 stop:986 length:189 start_codon:yes stop_codon:yes gene_type:complete
MSNIPNKIIKVDLSYDTSQFILKDGLTILQIKAIELKEARDRKDKLNKHVQWALGNTKKSEG